MAYPAILPVIMAGGAGTRLWPLSTESEPKQFLPLTGPRSTYELTLARVADRSLFATPVVITAEIFAPKALTQARNAGVEPVILLEPARRDSAAAVAAAALFAEPGQLVLVLAADHLIRDDEAFRDAVRQGVKAAERGAITIFGLKPTVASTSYGYIQPGEAMDGAPHCFTVKAFVEKPDHATAEAYQRDGYLWNSGNFLFRADAMIAAFETHAPDILAAVRGALRAARRSMPFVRLDEQAFAQARRTSIDYAIMEKAKSVAVVESHFPWSDIGGWDALWQNLAKDADGNAAVGGGHFVNSANTLVHAPGQTVVAAGVKDLTIVASGDTVLVMPTAQAQDVKKLAASFPVAPPPAFPKPLPSVAPGSLAFETTPLVKPQGFREYDARWWFGHPASDKPPELNLMGVQALGLGLGTLLAERGIGRDIVVGHDFRSYSQAIKLALVQGLMAAGMAVHDIGLCMTPMAYFAQFALDVPSVAMVTASHNENGWTGVKMGCERPVTFGPEDMARLRDIVLSAAFRFAPGGRYHFMEGFAATYAADLTSRGAPFTRKMKAVVACGNGTAGAFAPAILQRLGVEVIPLHCELDHRFPNYNPNPEDLHMLHDMARAVRETGADVALGFDGDGDRCGVVDNEGNEIFADKIGLMLARDLARLHPGTRFVVDVKSTGLYKSDEVLAATGCSTDYFKTGHSYIKRRVQDLGALAGFEKSGHFFFGPPVGRGYDDGMVTAIAVLAMLDRNPQHSLAELYRALPHSFGSPTMSAHCADEVKYDVVDRVITRLKTMTSIAGQAITSLNLVNGVRVETDDGTWGLVRASSNKPELVVVVESPVSHQRLKAMFAAIDGVLRENPEVGAYNQTI